MFSKYQLLSINGDEGEENKKEKKEIKNVKKEKVKKMKRKNVTLHFNGLKHGTVTGVLSELDEIDVSAFLREKINPAYFKELSAKIIVAIYVSMEESGMKPDKNAKGEEVLSAYIQKLETNVTDRDVVLVARLLKGDRFEPADGGSIKLDSLSLPY